MTTKKDFEKFSSSCSILILSYEMFTNNSNQIKSIKNFDIIICDEAHRLKNNTSKLYKEIESFTCLFKILLTATPIQNNMEEFYALIKLVHPNFQSNSLIFQKI